MKLNDIKPSLAQTWLCAPVPTQESAHSLESGFAAVKTVLTGDLRFAGSRTIDADLLIQPMNGAYGTSVSATRGTQKPIALAPAGVDSRGVPPRGRPV